MMFVHLETYKKFWLCTEQRFHFQYMSAFRWRVHTGPFPLGLCGEKYRFHGSRRLCLLYSQSSDPVPLLLRPLVGYRLNTDHTSLHTQHLNHYTGALTFSYKRIQVSHRVPHAHLWTDKSVAPDASPQMIFSHPSGYQTTSRLQYETRTTMWQQRGREFMTEGARQTSCRSETFLRWKSIQVRLCFHSFFLL